MIHTLGPAGTFSAKAARLASQALGREEAVVYSPSISAVFERVLADPAGLGVVPIENSQIGTVLLTQDLLAAKDVSIELEICVPVAFKLVAAPAREAIRRVFAHPAAWQQCLAALAAAFPGACHVATDSNTQSARQFIAECDRGDVAAVIPADYPLDAGGREVLVLDGGTAADNTTRFLAIRARPAQAPDWRRAKMSMLVRPHRDRPGLLHDLLGVFRTHDMSLSRIESRPAGKRWCYQFFLDVACGGRGAGAWADLQRGDWEVRLFGCYDQV